MSDYGKPTRCHGEHTVMMECGCVDRMQCCKFSGHAGNHVFQGSNFVHGCMKAPLGREETYYVVRRAEGEDEHEQSQEE